MHLCSSCKRDWERVCHPSKLSGWEIPQAQQGCSEMQGRVTRTDVLMTLAGGHPMLRPVHLSHSHASGPLPVLVSALHLPFQAHAPPPLCIWLVHILTLPAPVPPSRIRSKTGFSCYSALMRNVMGPCGHWPADPGTMIRFYYI